MTLTTPEDIAKLSIWQRSIVKSEHLPSAQSVLEKIESFKKRVSGFVTKNELQTCNSITTKDDLLQFVHQAKFEIVKAEEQKETLDVKRAHGVHKFGAKIQSFTNTFAKFVECYSGVVEIIKEAGGQYASVAYSTLSVLFIVAVNKSTIEGNIADALESFGNDFPRLADLCNLEPNEHRCNLLGKIYTNVIKYAQQATLYFKRSSLARTFYALFHPPKLFIDKIQQDIERDAKEIKDDVWAMGQVSIQEMKTQLREAHELDGKKAVLEAQRYLDVKEIDASEMANYQSSLQFKGVGKKYWRFDLKDLADKHAYNAWQDGNDSGLLLLQGHSLKTGSDLSWLSPAASELYEILQEDSKSVVTFCPVQTRPWMQEDLSPHTMVSIIILQLLKKNPDLLKTPNRLEFLRTNTQSESWSGKDLKKEFEFLQMLIDDIPITYLILDRIDRCACSPTILIDRLLTLVRCCKTVVKIFAIFGEQRNLDVETLDTTGVEGKFYVLTMDQGKRRPDSMVQED